jgi:hypothetical protein
MKHMRVRQAQTGDATAIAAVQVRSWQAAYRGLMPQAYLDSLDPAQRTALWDTVLAESAWPQAGVLVVEDQALVTGFAAMCPTRGPGRGSGAGGGDHRYLPGARSLGADAGRQLMTASLGVLAGAGYREATLWVLDSNQRARQTQQRTRPAPAPGRRW